MSAPPEWVEFRGQGELLAWLGILPVRGSGRSRGQAAAEAEAVLRRLGPWRWGRGFRVPVEILEGARGKGRAWGRVQGVPGAVVPPLG